MLDKPTSALAIRYAWVSSGLTGIDDVAIFAENARIKCNERDCAGDSIHDLP